MTGIVEEMVGMSKIKNRDFDFDGGRAASLDDGALTEILLHLPVKSVIRFQSVSKSWLSLISSDQFRRLHTLRRHKPPPSLILESHDEEIDSPDPSIWCKNVSLFYSNPKRIEKLTRMMMIPPFDTNNFETLSCSNGLMLMKCDKDYYVYNPTTMQSKKLSLIANNGNKFIHIKSIHLLFDPSKSLHYNIFCIRMDNSYLRHRIEVFNSKSGSWWVCVEPFTIDDGERNLLVNSWGACVGYKSLVFLIYCHTHFNSNYIYCFDIVKNVSELIAWPLPKLTQGNCSYTIQESNDCLYYCALFDDYVWPQPKLIIAALWKVQVSMDDPRCSEWEMMYRHTVHLEGGFGFDVHTFIAETMTMLIYSSRKIVAYDFRDKSYKEVLELEGDISCVNIFKCGETLALL